MVDTPAAEVQVVEAQFVEVQVVEACVAEAKVADAWVAEVKVVVDAQVAEAKVVVDVHVVEAKLLKYGLWRYRLLKHWLRRQRLLMHGLQRQRFPPSWGISRTCFGSKSLCWRLTLGQFIINGPISLIRHCYQMCSFFLCQAVNVSSQLCHDLVLFC